MQAFEGFRVLDLTHVLAGPFCTYQLGVLGAEVIKIEPPDEPDMVRDMGASPALNATGMGLHFLTQAANKKAITLNLRTETGRDILLKLAVSADVIVENYRAGAMEDLGLGFERLAAINPRLIYCSMTGFGHTGPKRGHTAFDNVIQAFSGLMAGTGTPETAPVRVGAPVLDYGTGAQAAFAIAAALTRRERTGKGQRIDVAMLDAAMVLMAANVVTTQALGQAPAPSGNSNPANHAYGCHQTADGLLMTGVHTTRQHTRLWRTLERDDIADQLENLSPADICARAEQDAPILKQVLGTRSAQEWERLLNNAGVPAARVRTLDETLACGQFEGRAILQECGEFPELGMSLKTPVAAFCTDEDGPRLKSPPPKLGEHNEAVLQELGFSREEIMDLRAQGVI